MKVIVFKDMGNSWRWDITARNGKIVATSGESFDSKGNAKRAAKAFVRNLIAAQVKDKLKFVDGEE